MARFATLLIPALLIAAPAAAQTEGPRSGERADIPFATNGGIRTFHVTSDGEGVYLQDRFRNWYYARFFVRCRELPFAFYIGYRTFGASSTLSRGDSILAGREQCKIADIVHSGPPPKKVKKPKATKTS